MIILERNFPNLRSEITTGFARRQFVRSYHYERKRRTFHWRTERWHWPLLDHSPQLSPKFEILLKRGHGQIIDLLQSERSDVRLSRWKPSTYKASFRLQSRKLARSCWSICSALISGVQAGLKETSFDRSSPDHAWQTVAEFVNDPCANFELDEFVPCRQRWEFPLSPRPEWTQCSDVLKQTQTNRIESNRIGSRRDRTNQQRKSVPANCAVDKKFVEGILIGHWTQIQSIPIGTGGEIRFLMNLNRLALAMRRVEQRRFLPKHPRSSAVGLDDVFSTVHAPRNFSNSTWFLSTEDEQTENFERQEQLKMNLILNERTLKMFEMFVAFDLRVNPPENTSRSGDSNRLPSYFHRTWSSFGWSLLPLGSLSYKAVLKSYNRSKFADFCGLLDSF